MSLKLLVLSDIHGSKDAATLANDHIRSLGIHGTVICGDITHFGERSWAASFFRELDGKVLGVTGNCDPPEVTRAYGDSGGVHLHMISHHMNEVSFAGLSGCDHSREDILHFKDISRGAQVYVFHVPPYGIHDHTGRGMHLGSEGVKWVVNENRPLLVLSGHVHECPGILNKDRITYINPGPAAKGHAAFVEISEGRIVTSKLL